MYVHAILANSVPSTDPRFLFLHIQVQGGSFDPWGGPGYDGELQN